MSALTDAIASAQTTLRVAQTTLVQAQTVAGQLATVLTNLEQQLAAAKSAAITDTGTPGVTDTGVKVTT